MSANESPVLEQTPVSQQEEQPQGLPSPTLHTHVHRYLLPLTNFLPLAPTMSASFPAPKKRSGSTGSIDQRSPTASNEDAKRPADMRFLKLGPVHYGEHPEDHQCDFA